MLVHGYVPTPLHFKTALKTFLYIINDLLFDILAAGYSVSSMVLLNWYPDYGAIEILL